MSRFRDNNNNQCTDKVNLTNRKQYKALSRSLANNPPTYEYSICRQEQSLTDRQKTNQRESLTSGSRWRRHRDKQEGCGRTDDSSSSSSDAQVSRIFREQQFLAQKGFSQQSFGLKEEFFIKRNFPGNRSSFGKRKESLGNL